MSGPSCRQFRELLGVYVLGAIEPAERSLVDAHLAGCLDCREELAGLAALPSLLHRVDPADAERIAAAVTSHGDPAQSPPDLLPRLLAAVGARRRTRRLRFAAAAAAAVLIAAGAGAAGARALGTRHPVRPPVLAVATASTHGLGARVRYGGTASGTAMWVQVSGFQPRTECEFWVITTSGQRSLAGAWTVSGAGDQIWYPARAVVPVGHVAGFAITSGGKVLLRVSVTGARTPAGNATGPSAGYRS